MARIEPVSFVDPRGRLIAVRNCVAGDGMVSIEFIRAIARETTFTNNLPDRKFSPAEEIERSWVAALDDANQLHVAAFCDGVMIGQLVCRRLEPGHPYIGHIARFGMMVLREFWGSGAARKLADGMDQYAQSQGIGRIEAVVRVDNVRGRRFYGKVGFVEEGTRGRAARIGDTWVDEIYIGKLYR